MRRLFAVGQQDLGDGQVQCQWSPRGAWLAAAGNKRVVVIYDRTGKLYGEIHLAPREFAAAETHQCCCLQLQWDANGEMLAVLPAGCSVVYIWTAATKELQKLETDFKAQEVTVLSWSNCSAVLAVGTVKGNLQLYFVKEHRKVPVAAKHTKRICAGSWALSENILALAAADKTVTISNLSGDTLKTLEMKGDPLQICAADCKNERSGSGSKTKDTAFSLITSKKTLCIIQGPKDASAAPLELSFMESYGSIAQHLWFGDGYILLGFRGGQVVVVSSLSQEVSREIHSHRPLDMLQDMAYCAAASRVAIGGGSTIKLLDVGAGYGEVLNESTELPAGHVVNQLSWGQDGQVLSVGTANGVLLTYLASLPSVLAAAGTKHAMLTSVGEVTVHDITKHSSAVLKVDCEPSFCYLGPHHLAVGVNNQVLYYTHDAGPSKLTNRRSYLGGVQTVCMNDTYAAVLMDGRVLVHGIEASGGAEAREDVCLPIPGAVRSEPITKVALSHHFLVTATGSGTLSYHVVQDGALAAVNEYRHTGGSITHLYPQPYGPRCVLADDQLTVALFSPLTDELTPLPGFDGSLELVLWDEEDPNLFVASNSKGQLFTYLLTQQSLSGQQLELLATVCLPVGHKPILLADGRLSVRLKSGAVDTWTLETHKPLSEQGDAKQLQKRLAAAIKLKRMPEALFAARALGSPDAWRQIAATALQQLDVGLAVAAYRQVGDAAMVLSLSSLVEVEDRNLLAGSLMVLLEQDINRAQELLLRSSQPLAALEMRQDLKHWPEALALAQRLAPDRVPTLSKEHAAMLEMVGEFAEARNHYQQALDALQTSGGDAQVQQACVSGMARSLLHLGDLRGGKALAQQINSSSLWKECAAILEQMHQNQDAAEMYEQAGMAEKAAGIYIAARNWAAAAPLMQRVTSAKLQLQYAKAKEGEGSYADAVAAYEAAGDLDSAVRLSLEKLGALGKAAALARKARSTPSAAQVARAALATGDVQLAIEFLLLAGQLDQAFDLAAAKGQLDTFRQLAAGSVKGEDDIVRLAQYLEGRGQPELAADAWVIAAQAERAIGLYAQVCTQGSLTKAIKALEDSQAVESAPLILAALDRCRGLEANVKDGLRLRLNMAAGQLGEAARDALELARREQEDGNYKLAHAKMFSTLQQLQAMGASVPLEFRQALALLHSYVLVKSLLAVGDHTGAACMLVRVAGNISRFPKHMVPILTSTVIECQRAGLKKTAWEYACTLMRPEYRNEVPEKYKKKIELMVRKPDRGEEPPEGLSACPFCHLPGPETQLQCVSCQSIIPCDIATGKRMTLQDWCECPSCHMPCSSQPFLAILAAEGKCPMCSAAVNMTDVRQVQPSLS